MKLFTGGQGERVKDQTVKPEPTEYPPLLPTLQTWLGMVTDKGRPQRRTPHLPQLDEKASKTLKDKATALRSQCRRLASKKTTIDKAAVWTNFEACSLPVTKTELLDYIPHGKRLDIEQAVAMVVAYLAQSPQTSDPSTDEKLLDGFEHNSTSVVHDLINDPSTTNMLTQTCMWREPKDFVLLGDPHDATNTANKNKILRLLGQAEEANALPGSSFTILLQSVRRKRTKLENSQHLTMPKELLPEHHSAEWTLTHSYRHGQQDPVPTTQPRVVSKSVFRKLDRILYRMRQPTDITSLYALDVSRFIAQSGALSPRRLAALTASNDPYAIAYSFIAAQRRRQLKVVSDQYWARFLRKGEGAALIQNRPDVLTSFEDILVRRAHDLMALTAIACPRGVRDHFSTAQEIRDRARGVCELMERYVRDFGGGKMQNLVFEPDKPGGSGRGPVDFYNRLCDELRECGARAKAVGLDLAIAPVYKFLAKDIMAWNNAWMDDAFAGGKVPGWLEYLARVRAEEIKLGD